MKYILITGGVCSGIGKGVVTSSIGAILKACNMKTTAIKIDPYHNIDAGTFSPYEHGEVYVLDDGLEVDLDLGNYERFMDIKLHGDNNITTGKINQLVIQRERQGFYLGKTVQTIPHMTDCIQKWIQTVATIPCDDDKVEPETCLIELGGTVGDIESMAHIAALRHLRSKVKPRNFCHIHVGWVISLLGEPKTKPIQRSVDALGGLGLSPDIIVCRSEIAISDQVRQKISDSCGVDIESVFSLPNINTIYAVPSELERQGVVAAISQTLKICIEPGESIAKWVRLSRIAIEATEVVTIALVGKYTKLVDSYTSVNKAIEHAAHTLGLKPKIVYIDATNLENQCIKAWEDLASAHGLLVPGGFGERGVEGKILALNWARSNNMPCLGICLGFQCAVIEFARNVLGMSRDIATSSEFIPETDSNRDNALVIEMLEYQDPERKFGGTMRLGLRDTKFVHKNCLVYELYNNSDTIQERHRHRYEINPIYVKSIESKGMRFVGTNEDGTRMEIMELDDHPYYVGMQYHPEYLSRPFRASPPYLGLIKAALQRKNAM